MPVLGLGLLYFIFIFIFFFKLHFCPPRFAGRQAQPQQQQQEKKDTKNNGAQEVNRGRSFAPFS